MIQSTADRKADVIGLGAMGLSTAKTPCNHDYTVYTCDVRPGTAADFAKGGGVTCATPTEMIAGVDMVVPVVVNAAQTEAALFGEADVAGTMQRGSALVMCSTADPSWSIALEACLAQRGILYVGDPVSGGAAKAASDQMTMVASAMPEAYVATGDMLDAMAGKVYRLGDKTGMSSKIKIINQLLAGVHIAAAVEAMALGLCEGVAVDVLYGVIARNVGNSWMFENRMAHVLTSDYMLLSAAGIFVEDLGLMLSTTRASKFPLPLTVTTHQMFMRAPTAGYAREDDSAVIKIFLGITLPGGQPR